MRHKTTRVRAPLLCVHLNRGRSQRVLLPYFAIVAVTIYRLPAEAIGVIFQNAFAQLQL